MQPLNFDLIWLIFGRYVDQRDSNLFSPIQKDSQKCVEFPMCYHYDLNHRKAQLNSNGKYMYCFSNLKMCLTITNVLCNLHLTRQVSYEQFIIYNDSLSRPTLGQLCTVLWDSQSQPNVIQLRFKPGCL
jgi:hypothetical protein